MTERKKQWDSWAEWLSTLTEEGKEEASYTYHSSTHAYVTACNEWIETFELINYQRSNLDPFHIIGQRFNDWFTPSDADWIDTRAEQIEEVNQ
jgi:hypothetical protein